MRELACPRGPHSEGWWEQALTPSQTSFLQAAHPHGRECPRSAGACWTFHGTPGPRHDAFLRLESAERLLFLPSGWGCPEGVALSPCQITGVRRQGHASTLNFSLRGGWDCVISIQPEMGHETLILEQASRLPSLPPFFFF